MGAFDGQHHSDAPILYRAYIELHHPEKPESQWTDRDGFIHLVPMRAAFNSVDTWGPYATVGPAHAAINKKKKGAYGKYITKAWVEYCVPEWKVVS